MLAILSVVPHSLVARIERSHRSDPGSIPGGGDFLHFGFLFNIYVQLKYYIINAQKY